MKVRTKMDSLFGSTERILWTTPWLQWIPPLLFNSGILAFSQRIRSAANGSHIEFQKFYEQKKEELGKVYDMLEDDFSRDTLKGLLNYRRTGKASYLKGLVVRPQYFQKDILSPVEDEVFVDGGAFQGDTVDSFVKNFAGGGYKRIYSWEPDEFNLKTLRKKQEKYKNLTVLPYGLWSGKTELYLDQMGNSNSTVTTEAGEGTRSLKVDSIDDLCSGDKVTFIKMDIEGSELEALKGAKNVIMRDKPRLAISIYHKPEDLYEIPFWIRSVMPEYKLYVRQHSRSWTETVLYAIL